MLGVEKAEAAVMQRAKVQKGADRTQRVNNYAEWHVRLGEWGGGTLYKKMEKSGC